MAKTTEFRIVHEVQPATRQEKYYIETRQVLLGVVPLVWKRAEGYNTKNEAVDNLEKKKDMLASQDGTMSSVVQQERFWVSK